MKKLQYYFFSIFLCSFLLAEDSIYLWDLGVKINPTKIGSEDEDIDQKVAALTKRHVSPKYISVERKKQSPLTSVIVSPQISSLNNIEKYNLSNKYFTSGRYVETIRLLEMVEFNKLNPKQRRHLIQLHLKALFNLGYYIRIINILTENMANDLNDELLFLLGMSSIELGEKVHALQAFNEIIENYPKSEYQNIAKLQARVLKR